MPTLFDITLAVARALGGVTDGVADTADERSITDAELRLRHGQLMLGTVWVLSGPCAGNSRVIEAQGDDSISFADMPEAIGAGARYSVATSDFPLDQLRAQVNSVLSELETTVYDTSLTTVADQEDYTLPDGVSDVCKVEIDLGFMPPWGYVEHRGWDVSGGKLRFRPGRAPNMSGCKIRLGHNVCLAPLVADSDQLPGDVSFPRLKWQAAERVLRWKMAHLRTVADDSPLNLMLADAMAKAIAAPGHSLHCLRKLPTIGGR